MCVIVCTCHLNKLVVLQQSCKWLYDMILKLPIKNCKRTCESCATDSQERESCSVACNCYNVSKSAGKFLDTLNNHANQLKRYSCLLYTNCV